MVVVLLGLSAGAWADVVTTAGGESLQGVGNLPRGECSGDNERVR
jgi:hypothetical protein